MRGEYISHMRSVLIPEELPPHARRIQRGGGEVTTSSGTTSACAENTFG